MCHQQQQRVAISKISNELISPLLYESIPRQSVISNNATCFTFGAILGATTTSLSPLQTPTKLK
jgi:hypothetical protein